MKLLRTLLLAGLFSLVFAAAQAQQAGPVLVQQTGSRLDACNAIAYATAAVNNTATATIPALSGNYAYICGISIDVCSSSTGTAQTLVSFTTTNIPNLPTFVYSTPALSTACINPPIREWFAAPVKSAAPGTAVTVVSPAIAALNAYTIRVYYYYAP